VATGRCSHRTMKDLVLRILASVESITSRGRFPVIYIPKPTLRIGGPRTFMALLVDGFRDRGMRVTSNRMVRADAAVIPISAPPEMVEAWRSRGTIIIQRLDGVFYDCVSGVFDPVRNHDTAILYRELADIVIFQSHYSRSQCSFFMGESGAPKSAVILNGTDLTRFRPDAHYVPRGDGIWRMVSTGNFRDSSMIVPIVKALDSLWEDRQDFRWSVIGPVSFPDADVFMHRPYIQHMEQSSREELAATLKQSDLFVYSFLNPNCPNSVIEAGACGLPVVGFDSGAMRELCGFNEALLAPMPNRVIHVESDLDADGLLTCIRMCLDEHAYFRACSMVHCSEFGVERSVDAYADVIRNGVSSRPLPT